MFKEDLLNALELPDVGRLMMFGRLEDWAGWPFDESSVPGLHSNSVAGWESYRWSRYSSLLPFFPLLEQWWWKSYRREADALPPSSCTDERWLWRGSSSGKGFLSSDSTLSIFFCASRTCARFRSFSDYDNSLWTERNCKDDCDRVKDRRRERRLERQRDRETERQKGRETERQRNMDTERLAS